MSYSVRQEEPPDDMVVVVRGGLAATDSIRRTAEVSQATHGFFGVSVFLVFDLTIEDLVRQVPELSPDRYRQLRTTTVGSLRTAGFGLLATGNWPHYDIVLADITNEAIERLQRCLGAPFVNPALGATMGET
jgi:hypothetical protein